MFLHYPPLLPGLSLGSCCYSGSLKRSHVWCCLSAVQISTWSMTVNQEGALHVCLCSCWWENVLLEPGGALASRCTTAPLRVLSVRWDLKRLFKFLLIVGLSDLVLLECTKHGRKYHPQRKCGCAMARLLKKTTERPGFHSSFTQFGQCLIMEIIP